VEVARTPRRIRIDALELLKYETEALRIRVCCSKGTYVRVLAEDIGGALGCGGALAGLRRVQVGRFEIENAVTLEALTAMTDSQRKGRVLPVDALLTGLPELELDSDQARRITRGQHVACSPSVGPGLIRIYGPHAQFLGLANSGEGYLRPRRLVSTAAARA
jgi:tRNA pseudouridine55 synthase